MCVEWGSVAEWVTAGVAVAAAGAAFWALKYNKAANAHARDAADAAAKSNELTAQAYRDDVRVREEAQARLVYATLDEVRSPILQGEEVSHIQRSGVPFVSLPGMASEHHGAANPSRLKDHARLVAITVHNESNEIISSIRVALYDASNKVEVECSTGLVALVPGASAVIDFIAPEDGLRYLPDIAFRDAAGKYWTRRGVDPIAPLADERRNKFGLPKTPS